MVAGGDCGFVYCRFDLTIPFKWTFVCFPAVAWFCGCWFGVDFGFIVRIYDPAHIVHATVADFDVVSVEYLV